jgi:heme/copper-type cytochrome/quinol oxidase subunit 2
MQKKIIFYLILILVFLFALVFILNYIFSRTFSDKKVESSWEESKKLEFIGPPPGASPYVKGPKSPPPFNN